MNHLLIQAPPNGFQAIAITTSLLPRNVQSIVENSLPNAQGACQVISLANLTSEAFLARTLQEYWSSASNKRYLVVFHDTHRSSPQRLNQFKFMCSKYRTEYNDSRNVTQAPSAAAAADPRVSSTMNIRTLAVPRYTLPASMPLPELVIKHVIILVHVPTNLSTVGGTKSSLPAPTTPRFTFNAELDYSYTFIDAIDTGASAGMAEVSDLVKSSTLKKVIDDGSLTNILPGVIAKEYKNCLPLLQYQKALVNCAWTDFLAQQMDMMKELLERDPFVKSLTASLAELMNTYTKNASQLTEVVETNLSTRSSGSRSISSGGTAITSIGLSTVAAAAASSPNLASSGAPKTTSISVRI